MLEVGGGWGSVIRPQWEDISHSLLCESGLHMFLREEVLWAPFNSTHLNWAPPDTIVGTRDGVCTVAVGDIWQSGNLVTLLSGVDE